jgi:thioredoxin 1
MRPVLLLFLLVSSSLFAQTRSQALVQQWRSAVMTGDAVKINALAADPARVQVQVQDGSSATFASEVERWVQMKKDGLVSVTAELMKEEHPQSGTTLLNLEVELRTSEHGKTKTRYEQEALGFADQGGNPKLVFFARGNQSFVKPLRQLNPHLYDEKADAKEEIADALRSAKLDHKKTLLVFGGNWCYDCHVLDAMFHQPDLAPTVNRGFHVVHVDIGRGEKNTDLVQKYGVNPERGVPAIAVLDAGGKLIFSDKGGEFSRARSMDPEVILGFLRQWAAK